MKKILMLLTMLVGTVTAQAEDYTYLTFETTDGAKASVSVASDVTLTNTDETTTGISEELRVNSEEFATATFYDLSGKMVDKSQLSKGVYIVKTNSRTYKMVVK